MVLVSPNFHQYLLESTFLNYFILMGVSHCSFNLNFPNDLRCWSFHVLIGHFYTFLAEIYIQILCLLLIEVFLSCPLYILHRNPFFRYMICSYFFSLCRLFFQLLDSCIYLEHKTLKMTSRKSNLFISSVACMEKHCLIWNQEDLVLYFSLRVL